MLSRVKVHYAVNQNSSFSLNLTHNINWDYIPWPLLFISRYCSSSIVLCCLPAVADCWLLFKLVCWMFNQLNLLYIAPWNGKHCVVTGNRRLGRSLRIFCFECKFFLHSTWCKTGVFYCSTDLCYCWRLIPGKLWYAINSWWFLQ